MPLYNRINGLLERSHAYMFMAYMYTGSNLYTESKEAFYIVEAYVSQSALHAHVEDSTMCLFSRDHMSPTLAFDYNYSFSQQEEDLQSKRLHQLQLHLAQVLQKNALRRKGPCDRRKLLHFLHEELYYKIEHSLRFQ